MVETRTTPMDAGTSTPPALAALGDDQLLLAAQQRNEQAFATLWQRLRPKLRRLLGGVSGQSGQAAELDELLQEASLQLFRALPRYRELGRGAAGARAWVYRLAVNVALMHRRRARRRPILALGEGFAEVAPISQRLPDGPATPASPEHEASLREQGQRLDQVLEVLPDKYRLVFWLADVEGQRMDEVALVLGITLPTAKARLLRARAMVRSALGQQRPETARHDLSP